MPTDAILPPVPAKTVLAFGELLWDLLPGGAVLGGAPANFAYRIKTLGHQALLITRLGRDPLGRAAWEKLESLGMDASFVQWDDHYPTGTVRVRLDPQGSPDFQILPDVAYDRIEWTEDLSRLAASTDCVCFGTLVQRSSISRATLEQLLAAAPRALKVLDLNLRKDCYSEDTIRASLGKADVLKLNEPEVLHLAGLLGLAATPLPVMAEEMVWRCGLSHCVVTLGSAGAFVATRGGAKTYSPGFKVSVADTCGSGDAFTAGFVHALIGGEPLVDCLRLGNALGALVATQSGATEPIDPEDLRSFVKGAPERVRAPAFSEWERG